MKTILTILVLSGSLSALCQSIPKRDICNYLLSKYPKDSTVNHQIDTIINLPNQKFFALVKTENSGGFTFESGYFDCYELQYTEEGLVTNKLCQKVSSNTGGSGLCELEYKLNTLDEENYLLICIKSVVNHGNFSRMYAILNSSNVIIETDLVDDFSGALPKTNFTQLIRMYKKGQHLVSFTFKTIKIQSGDPFYQKTNAFKVANFDRQLNCFHSIIHISSETRKFNVE